MADQRPFALGQVVTSTAGRDKGRYYVVVGFADERYALVADGTVRTSRRPKRKNFRHLRPGGPVSAQVAAQAARNRGVDDELIRRVVAQYSAGNKPDEASFEGG